MKILLFCFILIASIVPKISHCGSSQSTQTSLISPQKANKPIILFLIDGLRPDRLRLAVQEGLMPHLESLFIEKGVELNSFTQRSLTLPSWSTILTGFEADIHGIRSNCPTSLLTHGLSEDFLDPLPDILNPWNFKENRAFKKLKHDRVGVLGQTWLPDYFHSNEIFLNYMPISQNPQYPLNYLLDDFFNNLGQYANGIRDHASVLDRASARATAKAIRNDHHGKLKLIINWYASVDEASHFGNSILTSVYQNLDEGIGEIIQAAMDHPTLKDATVFLISDHGHSAGFGPFNNPSSPLVQNLTQNIRNDYQAFFSTPVSTSTGPMIVNTSVNLTHFFLGHFENYENYAFQVSSAFSEPSHFDLGLIRPIHKLKTKSPQKPKLARAYIDYAGNNLAQFYIDPEFDHKADPTQRLSYHQLSHFSHENLDIPRDLLGLKIQNLSTSQNTLAQILTDISENHPIHLFAMALPGENAKQSAMNWIGNSIDREPVLVLAKRKGNLDQGPLKAALILTRNGSQEEQQFRYLIIKNFSQDSEGNLSGEISNQSEDDPLGYSSLGFLPHPENSQWLTDREWIQRTQLHPFPTAIFSLVRTLTLNERYSLHNGIVPNEIQKRRRAETPDFIIIAHPGYSFHADYPAESDHGGLMHEEVRNTFMISSLNPSAFSTHQKHPHPIFSRDAFATVLDYADIGTIPSTQSISFKPWIDTLYGN